MSDGPGLAVVTGAARGIGGAVGLGLAEDGWSLLLVDACADQPGIGYAMPAPADLEAAAAACAAGRRAECRRASGRRGRAGVRVAAVRRARGAGPPAAAVAAAGVIAGGPGWATSEESWSTLIDVNLHGARRLAEATVPGMIEARRGRFVAVASAAALRAMPQLAAYSAAKAATVGYVRALAADLAGTGCQPTRSVPGSTRGAMLAASAELYDLGGQEEFAGQQLMRRLIDPAEVAAAAVWLCGPRHPR